VNDEKLADLDDAIAEVDEISRPLDEDRRIADPNRGVICSRGCAAGCSHVAYLVEAIKAEEDR
jgi:hypothetical protein